MFDRSYRGLVNLSALFQTELAIDTNITVTDTHAVVADTRIAVADTHTVVGDTHTMVVDIHRSVLTGRGDTSSQNHSVRATRRPVDKKKAYHLLEPSQVRDTDPYKVLSLTLLQHALW